MTLTVHQIALSNICQTVVLSNSSSDAQLVLRLIRMILFTDMFLLLCSTLLSTIILLLRRITCGKIQFVQVAIVYDNCP